MKTFILILSFITSSVIYAQHHCGSGNHGYYGSSYYNPKYVPPPTQPMKPYEFKRLQKVIAMQSFERDRLIIAKQAISSGRLLSAHVHDLMLQLNFDSSKLKLAKYAYAYVFDPRNYYLVNDAFTFSSSVRELNSYLGVM